MPPRGKPPRTRGIASRFERQLRQIAAHVGHVVRTFPPDDPNVRLMYGSEVVPTIRGILEKYSESLTEWARASVSRMLLDVNKQDASAWQERAKDLSRHLREEISSAPTGKIMQRLMAEQVGLIKSIPIEAAQRVHELTMAGISDSTRASEIAKEIMRSGDVAKSRATLIARTEVARTASVLTQARAEHIGSTHYIWRSAEDSDVRDSHRKMDGKVFEWAHPPLLSDGTRTAPGQIYNCRCYPEVIL